MRESELQTWFEKQLEDETLCKYINNIEAFRQRQNDLETNSLEAESMSRVWVKKASFALASLCNSEKVLANKSIHALGKPQKRPDFLLQDCCGRYVLVELKTNSKAERQGIQQLLAYSAELHQQVPFLVGVTLVIVAKDWSELLIKASKGALLAGVHLLPLRVLGDIANGIKLEINLDILEAPTPTPIHALSALTPYSLARHTTSNSDRTHTMNRLSLLSERVQRGCKKVAQTGFVCVWEALDSSQETPVIGITLFSVDPHWMFGNDIEVSQEQAGTPEFLKKAHTHTSPTNPSFNLMDLISQREQKDLDLDWGTDGGTFESYLNNISKYYYWSTLIVWPFGTMQDFWRSKLLIDYPKCCVTLEQLKQIIVAFDQYHAECYGTRVGKTSGGSHLEGIFNTR